MQRLIIYGETLVTMSVRDAYFDADHVLASEDGLNFAFGITHYDSNQEAVDDPRYG